VESSEREEDILAARVSGNDAAPAPVLQQADSNGDPSSEETLQGEEEEEDADAEAVTPEDDDDDADLSDAESFTLKDRQEAINETHPFGIRIWKPALYKKNRSVQRNAEGDIHSAPGGNVSRWLWVFNGLWTVIFGWWLSLIAGVGGVINLLLSLIFGIKSCGEYGRVLINLSHYLFYPFGKYVKLEHDEAYLHEDEGEGRSISEYERWQTGDLEEGRLFFGPTDINRSIIGRRRDEVEDLDPPADETDSLLGRQGRQSSTQRARTKTKKRLFGRGKWNVGRVVFFLSFYFLITPCLFIVSAVCWFLVFTIPMGKVTLLLFYHLRRHPLALSFHTDSHYARLGTISRSTSGSSILLCTYRAVGLKYWKYTIDGTNIFLINLLGLVVFVIFDYFVLYEFLGIRTWVTSLGLVFVLALASIIPLAYFIGQAVASISAQSSMGVGATINAFFSTVVEVFLYCVALQQGKAQLVEGSIIGSIFAGILFLPGLSMCFGAIRRKTQRFNVKSAGVTSTMLLFAVIGAFGPTLFYQIYGSHELNCKQCIDVGKKGEIDRDCRRCYFAQIPAIQDRFFVEAVQPYIWFAAVCLFLSYVVGLLFTLRTHAAVIWNNEPDEKKDAKMEEAARRYEERHHSIVPGTGGLAVQEQTPTTTSRPGTFRGDTAGTMGSVARDNIRDSQMYKRILQQSLKQAGLTPHAPRSDGEEASPTKVDGTGPQTPYLVPPKSADGEASSMKSVRIQGLSPEDNRALVQQVAEMAATAATVAARDATKSPLKARTMATTAATGSTKSRPDGKDCKDGTHRAVHIDPGSLGDSTELPTDGGATPAAPEKHEEHASGGHDAPNWSRTKSAVILLTATVAYAIIAEILVDTVDAVLSNSDIDEKFLGKTPRRSHQARKTN
jgi:Ca2+:H+ antiporter